MSDGGLFVDDLCTHMYPAIGDAASYTALSLMKCISPSLVKAYIYAMVKGFLISLTLKEDRFSTRRSRLEKSNVVREFIPTFAILLCIRQIHALS
jgi:hypothetical protein